jgi:putative DNA primase/helicase
MSVLPKKAKARREEIAAAAIASPNEVYGEMLLTRCLDDRNGDAIARYGDALTKLPSPIQRKIGNAIRTLYYDGKSTNFVAVERYLDGRGELNEVGKFTLHQLGGGVVFADAACDGARDAVLDAYIETESTRVLKDGAAGKISAAQVRDKLIDIFYQPETAEKSWTDALNESVVASRELHDLQLTPRRKLLGDWFCEGDLGFIFAFRGVGKTWLALAIAQALSTGGKLGEWQAHEAVKVLYVDGEMPPDLMRERCDGLQASNANLEFLNHEILFDRTGKTLNITNRDVQQAITRRCLDGAIKVLLLDNLSTLASGMKENEADDWELVNNWLLDLRRRKIAVVIIHHAGRSGEMRGTSKREDNVFWIIALNDMKKDADNKRGARFVSHFTKPSRNTQEEIPAFEWHFVTEASGQVTIAHKPAQTLDVFRSVLESGVTKCDEIAAVMKVEKYTVSRLAKKAERAGWLKKSRGEYVLVESKK